MRRGFCLGLEEIGAAQQIRGLAAEPSHVAPVEDQIVELEDAACPTARRVAHTASAPSVRGSATRASTRRSVWSHASWKSTAGARSGAEARSCRSAATSRGSAGAEPAGLLEGFTRDA